MTRLSAIWVGFMLAGGLAIPATGLEPGVAGTWVGNATGIAGSRPVSQDVTMVLAQKGPDVTGTLSTAFQAGGRITEAGRKTTVRVKGTAVGDELLLSVGPNGRLQATVRGESMSGSLERANNPPLAFTATRAK